MKNIQFLTIIMLSAMLLSCGVHRRTASDKTSSDNVSTERLRADGDSIEDLNHINKKKLPHEQVFDYPGSGISYKVVYNNKRVCIYPHGLSIVNDSLTHDLNGYHVSHIETGDLNIDGYPEPYVFLLSNTPEQYGDLIAYSPNNGKSLSQIYLPKIGDDEKLVKEYAGHDEMEIVENSLCRRFPIKGTDKIRQLQYHLVAGESGWTLKPYKILEY
ncbi:MAG: hypothetical protein ACI4T9_05025 [Prevotella sp.]